jgi:ABC-type uncharacterized transport system auxiliary subunit
MLNYLNVRRVSMKNKIAILVTLILFILSLSGCGTNTTATTAYNTKVNILATADTHSIIPQEKNLKNRIIESRNWLRN